MKRILAVLATIALIPFSAFAQGSSMDGGITLRPVSGQSDSDNAIIVVDTSGTTQYTVQYDGTPSTAVTVDGTSNLDFDDGTTDSPSLIFTDETNQTATFKKEDTTDFTLTLSEATQGLEIVTGNLFIGNGTPGQTINGEDLYVEGISEFDGAMYVDNDVQVTPSAGTAHLTVLTGNIKVGNGSETQTLNGEDLYVEGHIELDGTLNADGAIVVASTSALGGNVTLDDNSGASPDLTFTDETNETAVFSKADSGYLSVTTQAADGLQILTGSLKIGNGSPTGTINGEDLYVEGIFEVDGAARFDSTIDANGAITASSTLALDLTNAAGASANPVDYTVTTGIMDGSDDLTLLDVNLTNANHTGASNTIQVLDVANITGDADATETAIKIGTGWDDGINSSSPITLASAALSLGSQQTFGESDETPDVSGGSMWITHSTADTITDFDAGSGTLTNGQIIVVESGGAITYDVTTSGLKGGSTDLVTAAGDLTVWVYDGTDWLLISFTDQSDDLS